MKKHLALLLVAVAFFGCSKKSPTSTTTVQSKFILADVERQGTFSFWERVDIYSDPAPNPAQCTAQLKFGSTTLLLSGGQLWPGLVRIEDTLRFPYPGVCSLFVSTNLGSSRGGVDAPGTYAITTPTEGDTLPWGNVAVAWTQSQNASWYELWVLPGTGWIDTTLIVTGTSAVIPEGFLRKFGSGDVWLYLFAHSGAAPGVGSSGNLTGDIKGVFFSTFIDTFPNSFRGFYIGSPPKLALCAEVPRPQVSHEKRRQFIIQAFGLPVRSGAD